MNAFDAPLVPVSCRRYCVTPLLSVPAATLDAETPAPEAVDRGHDIVERSSTRAVKVLVVADESPVPVWIVMLGVDEEEPGHVDIALGDGDLPGGELIRR